MAVWTARDNMPATGRSSDSGETEPRAFENLNTRVQTFEHLLVRVIDHSIHLRIRVRFCPLC